MIRSLFGMSVPMPNERVENFGIFLFLNVRFVLATLRYSNHLGDWKFWCICSINPVCAMSDW